MPQLFSKKSGRASGTRNVGSPQVEALGKDNSTAVFIFGFDSMKQFYRNAVKELSSKLNINLYLANPFGDVAKESNNELLKYWGNSGKRNIELWGKNDSNPADNDSLWIATPLSEARNDGNGSNCVCNCNLKLLQRAIVENKKEIDCDTALCESSPLRQCVTASTQSGGASSNCNDDSLVMISAPTKLREVEILHSNICKLLLNKKAQIKDIIVASPNLDAYRSVIYQVFNQSPQKADDNSSQTAALHLPFSIVDSSENESLTHLALKRLFSLKEKGVLSRPDFFDLVRNPVVQAARGILPDEVSNWEGWISSLNIYRDRIIADNNNTYKEKNWIKSVKSLLLAKLSNVAIDFSEGETIKPFSDIASSDNESVCRFIDCIDDIEEWLKIGGGASSSIDEAFNKIEKWLLMNKVPSGLGNENYIFQKIKKAKDELKWQYAAGSKSISWKIFSKTLLNASSKAKYNTGNLFVNGITFMNLVPNRVIPTKFMFLLGIDEKTFPRKDYNNSLDLRHEKPIDSDELNSEKDKYAFLNQLLNVKEAIYISYVNKDLQKDEDYYPSSVIDDILRYFKKLGKNLEIEKTFNVENRDWKDLFTQSALRNKETYEMMMGKGNKEKTPSVSLPLASSATRSHPVARLHAAILDGSPNSFSNFGGASKDVYPERVTVYQLRSFLEEPFKARIDRILFSEDEEDAEKIEFEPIVIDKLKESIIKKQLVLNGLEGVTNLEEKFDEIIAEKSIEFPQKEFGDKVKRDLISLSNDYINHIRSRFKDKDFSYKTLNLSVDLENIIDRKSFRWNLSGTANIVAENEKELHIIDLMNTNYIKEKSKFKFHYLLNVYIYALINVANGKEKEKAIYIDLFEPNANCVKGENKAIISVKIDCCPECATKILNDIYLKMFVNNYHKVLPIDLFKENQLDYHKYLETFDDEYGPWGYFSASKLFDIRDERISGFTEVNFKTEWGKEKTEQLKLFPEGLRDIIMGDKK